MDPGPARVRRSATDRMRAYWDDRARENAMWFVDTSLRFDEPDLDQFMATGREVVRQAYVDAPVRPAATALAVEIGSGLGRVCAALVDHFDEVTGIDIAPEMVERARRLVDHERVAFVAGDGATLAPVGDGSVDLLVSFTVFQHIPDPDVIGSYLAEAGRVLRPGGVIAFQWNNEPGARRWRLRRRVLDFLQRSGIRPERRGRNAAEFLGSRVPLDDVERMLDRAGLVLEAVEGSGTLFTWAWARRPTS